MPNNFLLVEKFPVIIMGLSNLIKTTIKDVDLHVATSFGQTRAMMSTHQYQMVMICLPSTSGPEMEMILDMMKSGVKSLLFFSEYPKALPPHAIYLDCNIGILDKSATPQELGKAIKEVYNGNMYLGQHLMHELFLRPVEKEDPFEILTKQETIIMELLLEGRSNLQICKLLALQPSTISTHKIKIFGKLNITNLLQLDNLSRGIQRYIQPGIKDVFV